MRGEPRKTCKKQVEDEIKKIDLKKRMPFIDLSGNRVWRWSCHEWGESGHPRQQGQNQIKTGLRLQLWLQQRWRRLLLLLGNNNKCTDMWIKIIQLQHTVFHQCSSNMIKRRWSVTARLILKEKGNKTLKRSWWTYKPVSQ